jgi:hypothetical protein
VLPSRLTAAAQGSDSCGPKSVNKRIKRQTFASETSK